MCPEAGGSTPMKNIFELLRQKEAELRELQREVEALRLTAKLLADGEHPAESVIHALRSEPAAPPVRSGRAVMRAATPAPRPAAKDFNTGNALLRQFP